MKRYFRVYTVLGKLSLETLLAYRSNFVNSIVSSLSWGFFSFFSILLLVSKTTSIYGWTPTEIILLTCGYSILIGVFHTLFSTNFERMADLINLGQLDAFLLRPLDSQFSLSLWWVNYTSIVRILLGGGFLWYIMHTSATPVTVVSAASFIVLVSVGILLLYSLWFITATLLVWFPRMSNVIELLYNVSGVVRYPGEMYRHALGYMFFLFLPLTLIITTPVKLLVGKSASWEMILLVVFAVCFLVISRMFWKFALRYYASASGT